MGLCPCSLMEGAWLWESGLYVISKWRLIKMMRGGGRGQRWGVSDQTSEQRAALESVVALGKGVISGY